MTEDEYLKQRLEPQIAWYDSRSTKCKYLSLTARTIEIFCAAAIPFLAGYQSDFPHLSIVIGLLGVAVALAAGLSALNKHQELWIKYRTTAESLKKEKYLFLTATEPYDTDEKLPTLVQRVETLVSQENTNWAQYMMKPGKGDAHA